VVRCFFQNGRNAGEQQQIKLQSQIKFAKKKRKKACARKLAPKRMSNRIYAGVNR